MGQRFEMPIFQGFDGNGDPLIGGLLYSYIAGTSTAKALYYDKTLETPASNPVILNSYGYAQNASAVTTGIYGSGSYKLVLKNSAGVTQWTLDNVTGIGGGEGGLYVSDYGCDLAAAVADIGADEVTLTIDCDVAVAADLVCPATLNLRWLRGNLVTVASTKTLTIGNMTDPGEFTLFAGAGTVVFSSGAVDFIRPGWFGCIGDSTGVTGNGTDNTAAMTLAIQCALTNTIPLRIPPTGIYRFASGMTFTEAATFDYSRPIITGPYTGRHNYAPAESIGTLHGYFFKDFTGDHLLEFVANSVLTKSRAPNISGFGIIGQNAVAKDIAIEEAYSLLKFKYFADGTIQNMSFAHHGGPAVTLEDCGDLTFRSCFFGSCGSPTNTLASLVITGGELEEDGVTLIPGSRSSNWIMMENCRFEAGWYTELSVVGANSGENVARDIHMLDNKFHGRSTQIVDATGPLLYFENCERVLMTNNVLTNGGLAGFHLKNVAEFFCSDFVIRVNGPKVILEGKSYAFFDMGATNQIVSAVIAGMSRANPCEVTTEVAHGLETDDWVYFDGITQDATYDDDPVVAATTWRTMNDENTNAFQIVSTGDTTFTLKKDTVAFDTSGFADAYVPDIVTPYGNGKLYRDFFRISADSVLWWGPNISVFGTRTGTLYPFLPGRHDGALKRKAVGVTRDWSYGNGEQHIRDSAPSNILYARVLNEVYDRMILSLAALKLGGGAATQDVELIRTGVEKLSLTTPARLALDRVRFNPLAAVPTDLQEGDVAYDDGTNWSGGGAKGLYCYTGAAWVKMT